MANVPIRPLGVKFFGAFLTPYPSGDYESQYNNLWSFENGFKPQIDAVKSLGGNFVAYMGGANIVARGVLPLATYLARRRQVAEYISSLGLYGLSYGSGMEVMMQAGFDNAAYCAVIAEDAKMHSAFLSQIGYATIDEPWGASVDFSGGTLANSVIVANVAAQYAACKAVVPDSFGICGAPNPSIQSGSAAFDYAGASQVRCDSMAPYCDFLAFHPFYNMTLAETAPIRTAFPSKNIMMPSSVLTLDTDTSTEIANRAAAVMNRVGANGFRGMGQFVAMKFDTNTFNLFDHTGTNPPVLTEKALKAAAFRANNTAVDLRTRRNVPGKPRITELLKTGYAQ